MIHRPRRLRMNSLLRDMLADVRLSPGDFVLPMFVRNGHNASQPVGAMPGVNQLSPDLAVEELRELADLGVRAAILFGVTEPEHKDPAGSYAHDRNNPVCQTLLAAKKAGVNILLMTDLCYCEYTSHGQCGPVDACGHVHNDQTLELLGKQAVVHAQCGADIVAPSGMMDGMVRAIRQSLDAAGHSNLPILSYAVKYASSFYGPFREAAGSTPTEGPAPDRRTHQMDYRRGLSEALQEAQLDIDQGADMIMVKPGLPYLDVLAHLSRTLNVPTCVYQVSGEYAMIKAAAKNGWVDEKAVALESLYAFKRAGASFILTYFAKDAAKWTS